MFTNRQLSSNVDSNNGKIHTYKILKGLLRLTSRTLVTHWLKTTDIRHKKWFRQYFRARISIN